MWLKNYLKIFFKKIKKNKGGKPKNFFKNGNPKNKKIGKNLKKNNFQKKFFLKKLTMGKEILDLRGRVFYYIIYSN